MQPETSEFDWEAASAGLPRVPPPCPHFGVCGGCRLQDLAYGDQVLLKERRLRELFAARNLESALSLPPVTGNPFGYRSRLRFSVKNVPKKGGVLVGFHERKKRYLVDMRTCPILPDGISTLIGPLRDLMNSWSRPRSVPQISVSAYEGGDAYCFRVLEDPTEADLGLLRSFEKTNRVRVFLQTGGYETTVPLTKDVSPLLSYRLGDFDLTVGYRPHHFTQVNEAVNKAMLRQALDLLKIREGEKGLDLFCGVGNFALVMAHDGAEVLGIDSEGDQIAVARENAVSNGLSNRIRFEAGDLYTAEGIQNLPWEGQAFALLDPPRTGAMEVCRALPEGKNLRLLYISCNPETLARDAEILVREKGMRLEALGLLDMFPQTLQAEAMAYFERPNGAAGG